MITFERTLRFLTSVQFLGSIFFAILFLPAFSLLLDSKFAYGIINIGVTIVCIFILSSLMDMIPDTLFVAIVMISSNVSALTYGLISGFTGAGIVICIQWLVYFIVTRDSITDLHDDICIVMKHRDDLYNECIEIEESNKKT